MFLSRGVWLVELGVFVAGVGVEMLVDSRGLALWIRGVVVGFS